MKDELAIFLRKREAIVLVVNALHEAVMLESENEEPRQHNFFVNREHFEESIHHTLCNEIDNRYHQKASRKFIDKLFDRA